MISTRSPSGPHLAERRLPGLPIPSVMYSACSRMHRPVFLSANGASSEADITVFALLDPVTLAHQPLEPWPEDQVKGQLLVRKHSQCSLARVGDHLRSLLYGQLRILLDHLHDHLNHQLHAPDQACFFHTLCWRLNGDWRVIARQ